MTTTDKPFRTLLLAVAALGLFSLSGCAAMDLGSGSEQNAAVAPMEDPPYFAHEFNDLLIPKELDWNRDKSMFIRTDSFAGGVLHYSGRVDVASLADFFSNSMVKNGWKMVGSAKYKNVLLSFFKPDKTCTIILSEGELRYKTEAHIYITEDLSKKGQQTTPAKPFGMGM